MASMPAHVETKVCSQENIAIYELYNPDSDPYPSQISRDERNDDYCGGLDDALPWEMYRIHHRSILIWPHYMLSTSFTFTRARNYSSQPSGSAENMSTDSGSLTLYNICNSIHSCLSTNGRPNAVSHNLKQFEDGSQCCEVSRLEQ